MRPARSQPRTATPLEFAIHESGCVRREGNLGALPVRSRLVDRRFRDHGVCEYRPPSSSLIAPYPYPFAPRLYLSTSSIYVPSRSSLPLRRASVVHRRLLEACPSTLARRSPLPPSSIVASSVIASSPLTGNGRLKTEIRAAKFGDGTRNLRSPSQAAEAHARKTARGHSRNRTAGAGVLFRVGTAAKSNRNPDGKRLTRVHANH